MVLTLDDTTISNNYTFHGGGLLAETSRAHSETINISGSTISGNTAINGKGG